MHQSLWEIFKERRREKKRRKAFEREIDFIRSKRQVYRITPCGSTAWKVDFKIIHGFNNAGSSWVQLGVYPDQQKAKDAIHTAIHVWAKKIAHDVVECERKFFQNYDTNEYSSNEFYGGTSFNQVFAEVVTDERLKFIDSLSPSEKKRYYKEMRA